MSTMLIGELAPGVSYISLNLGVQPAKASAGLGLETKRTA